MLDKIKVSSLLNSIVPISRFNRGEASKIFEEVSSDGYKVVVKNNKPSCVLMSPKKYEEMIETLEDYQLYIEAEKRLKSASESDFIGQDDVLKTFHISQKDLNEADEAEIEQ